MTFAQTRLGTQPCGFLAQHAFTRVPQTPMAHRLPPTSRLVCKAVAYDERQATTPSTPSIRPIEPVADALDLPAGSTNATEAVKQVSETERARRAKISAANRGRKPWNKGIHLSDELRQKIAQRTREAMSRPEVRAKLRRGNRMRPPHTDDVRNRIRTNLKARSVRIKAALSEQAPGIVAEMRERGSEEEKAAIEPWDDVKAGDVFVRLAWRVIKADYDRVYDLWKSNHNGLRERFMTRLTELEAKRLEALEKSRLLRQRRVLSQGSKTVTRSSSSSKLRLAFSTQNKLTEAESRLEAGKNLLKKLQASKAVLAADPAKLQAIAHAEAQATGVIEKLRVQVNALHEAMAPLQTYLQPKDGAFDAMTAAATSRANGDHHHPTHNGATVVNGVSAPCGAAVNGSGSKRNVDGAVAMNSSSLSSKNNTYVNGTVVMNGTSVQGFQANGTGNVPMQTGAHQHAVREVN